jgi:hypothetical protein
METIDDATLTVRDQFAMAALAGLLANHNINPAIAFDAKNFSLLPKSAYALADEMLIQRSCNHG